MGCRGLGDIDSCRCRLASLFPARPIRVDDAFSDWLSNLGKWVQAVAVKV